MTSIIFFELLKIQKLIILIRISFRENLSESQIKRIKPSTVQFLADLLGNFPSYSHKPKAKTAPVASRSDWSKRNA